MEKLLFLVAALCISCTSGVPSINTRIVGGEDASPGQFPHQISMQYNGRHRCGGSIINTTKILTAAHCVYGVNVSIDVIAGVNNLNDANAQRIRVAQVYYHPSFNFTTLINDIAILILSEPLTFNELVQPIQLANEDPQPNATVTFSGWGFLEIPPLEDTLQLQTITLTILSLEECAYIFRQRLNPVIPGNLCTTSPAGHAPCQGDSGGPLIDQNRVQVGVLSWGVACAYGFPEVFTSVAFFRNYINSIN